mgnify:CR=1 FL=1
MKKMKSEEFDYISEILDRLYKIHPLFYSNSSTAEAHYELGKLMQYVQNIYEDTDEVEE